MDNKYEINSENQSHISLIIEAFKMIFKQTPTDKNCELPLRILQLFYMEHDHLIKFILPDLSISLIQYVYQYSDEKYPFHEKVKKQGLRFMDTIQSNFDIILENLSKETILNCQNNKSSIQIVKMIEFIFDNLSSTQDEQSQPLIHQKYLLYNNILKIRHSGFFGTAEHHLQHQGPRAARLHDHRFESADQDFQFFHRQTGLQEYRRADFQEFPVKILANNHSTEQGGGQSVAKLPDSEPLHPLLQGADNAQFRLQNPGHINVRAV